MELMSILQDCNYKESEKMANITNYLNKIKTAVYGKDVRGAIHDAINKSMMMHQLITTMQIWKLKWLVELIIH